MSLVRSFPEEDDPEFEKQLQLWLDHITAGFKTEAGKQVFDALTREYNAKLVDIQNKCPHTSVQKKWDCEADDNVLLCRCNSCQKQWTEYS